VSDVQENRASEERNLGDGDHSKDEKEFLADELAGRRAVAHVPDVAKHIAPEPTLQQDRVDHVRPDETVLPGTRPTTTGGTG